MAPLSQATKDLRDEARHQLILIAKHANTDPEHRTGAAAVLLQDIAIEENS